MAARAVHDGHEVLAALSLRLGESRRTDMRKLPAARAVQMIDLMELLCPRLNPAKMAEAKLE